MGYQQVMIQGGLVRDAEIRQVGQSQVAQISVAVSERWKDRNGQMQENTEYFNVEVWDKPGIYPYLIKSCQVLVVGQQKTEKWTDNQGQNRESKKVRAQVIQLCGGKPQNAPAQSPAPQYNQPAPPPQYGAPAQRQAYQAGPAMPPPPAAAPQYLNDMPPAPGYGDLPL